MGVDMKKLITIILGLNYILMTGCAIFDSPDEFDVDSLPPTAAGGSTTISSQIASSTDDAEERSGGYVATSNSTLELTTFKGAEQIVALRFKLDLPKDVVMTDAYIQFTADSADNAQSQLVLFGEASDNASTFEVISKSIRVRELTTASVDWSPAAWNSAGESGVAQRTPSLIPIIEEIVTRPGWSPENHITFYIKGPGTRVAKSFDQSSNDAATLSVTYASASSEPPSFVYQGLAYDPIVKPVYDYGYRDGFLSIDTDSDGLPDGWEVAYGLDPSNEQDGIADPDQDMLTAKEEFLTGTSPIDPDSDGDGMPDGYEVSYGLNPTNGADALLDADGDGHTNLDEYLAGSDPTNPLVFPVIIPPTYNIEVSWVAPTTREDGTALSSDQIAGYNVYYGSALNNLNNTIKIEDPSSRSTTLTVDNSGSYYFSVTVIDDSGAESNFSNTQQITVK